MTKSDWARARVVNVVTEADSWGLPWAQQLVDRLNAEGDQAELITSYDDVKPGTVTFYLNCTRRTPPEILDRNSSNLVVHASDLPKGRGFSPLTWMVLEECDRIPVCLLHAVDEVDAGPIIYKDFIDFEGHELIGSMRALLGAKTVELCLRFMNEDAPCAGVAQEGEATWYPRRHPADSEVDPKDTIENLFNQFRVADNEAYPVVFRLKGKTYRLKIEEVEE